jgi:glycerol uptake facilitator-like aquaporin
MHDATGAPDRRGHVELCRFAGVARAGESEGAGPAGANLPSTSYPLNRRLAVEFIGTFLFVFTVGMATNKAARAPWRRSRSARCWIYRLADFLGGAAAARAFLYVQPAKKPTGDIEAASTH